MCLIFDRIAKHYVSRELIVSSCHDHFLYIFFFFFFLRKVQLHILNDHCVVCSVYSMRRTQIDT